MDSFHDYFDGRPYIDRVMTRVIPDLATMFLELKALSIDQMGLTPLQYVVRPTLNGLMIISTSINTWVLDTPTWAIICKTGNLRTNASDRL